jgi:hypothetical protein
MKLKLQSFSILWILFAILAFPSFYFVYKFGNPMYGTNDFFSYYKLYQNWDIQNVEAPFNMRLLSSFFVFLLNKIGLHYDTACAFDQFQLDKQVFFNAIFFNYLCITSTSVVLYYTIIKHLKSTMLAFISGLIYLLGFGTLFYEFMPITDALSILLFAIILYAYLEKSYWLIFPLLLLVMQREYVFLALGLVSLLDFWKYKLKYYLHILLSCIVCFTIYFILRKTIFYTPRFDYQASPAFFIDSLFKIKFPLIPYIKQTLMTLNIFIIYLLIVFYKKWKKLEIDQFNLLKLILLFLQINIISFVAVFGNNTGRYFYILIPLIIFQLMKELKTVISFKIQE